MMYELNQITPRILVTTDFTPESERALYHGLAFAVAHQARLTLLHTGPESRDAEDSEQAPAPLLSQQPTLNWPHETYRGKKALDNTIGPARELDTDMIVVNSHGTRGLLGRMHSSQTEKLLRSLSLPLLAVPPP